MAKENKNKEQPRIWVIKVKIALNAILNIVHKIDTGKSVYKRK